VWVHSGNRDRRVAHFTSCSIGGRSEARGGWKWWWKRSTREMWELMSATGQSRTSLEGKISPNCTFCPLTLAGGCALPTQRCASVWHNWRTPHRKSRDFPGHSFWSDSSYNYPTVFIHDRFCAGRINWGLWWPCSPAVLSLSSIGWQSWSYSRCTG